MSVLYCQLLPDWFVGLMYSLIFQALLDDAYGQYGTSGDLNSLLIKYENTQYQYCLRLMTTSRL